ncbi:MAG TPA: DUF4382 domain-containing protein [Candidatus Acidoferrum sp.]|nr:DUF4382 domain-containing protein [Candidatus Acidoferrum sp.]
MGRIKNFLIISTLLLAALSLTSCTLKRPCPLCGGGGGGGGNTTGVSATLAAVPLTPPPGTNILSFVVTITGVSLTPSAGGTAVQLNLPATSITVDLMRLQSDSTLLGEALSNVPAATYDKVSVSVSNVVVTYCTQVSPGTPGCTAGTVKQVTQSATVPATSSFSLMLSSGQVAAVQVQFNLAHAITISATQPQVVSAVDLTASNVLTASVLPPASSSLGNGQSDFIEDFTGLVTNAIVSSQTVTIRTATRGTITATANSSTFYSPNCTSPPFNSTADIHCVTTGDIASVDMALDATGSFTLLDYDPLDTAASDWIEGVVMIVPTSTTQFQIVANDLFQPSSGSLVGTKLPLGSTVTLNLSTSPAATFGVDERGLTVPADTTTFISANDTSVLRAGQDVAVHISTFTAAAGSTPATATADVVELRFSRVTGTVSSPNSVSFSFQTSSLPAYFGQTTIELAELNAASAPSSAPTNYDGVSAGTGLIVGDTVSIRALYFGPNSAMPFTCAKVRKH